VAEDRAGDRSDLVATPEQLADQRMARKLLDRLLDEMDPQIRSVFVLYELEEMTMGEIANLLEIPGGTVASRLRRARTEFKSLVRRLQGQTNRRAEP
jgi:RNA polymerase sigma-70 factor (ECF subfamily)